MKNLLSVSDLNENQIKKLILVAAEIISGKQVSAHALKNKSLALTRSKQIEIKNYKKK